VQIKKFGNCADHYWWEMQLILDYAVLVVRLLCCELRYVCVNAPFQQQSGNLAQCNVSAPQQTVAISCHDV